MSNTLKGNIAAFVAMILWATGFPVAAAILETWHPLLLAPFRLASAAIALLGIFFLSGGWRYLRDINWWDIAWIGGGLLSASTILLLYGQDLAHPITVAVIISMMPLISAVMGWIGGTERLTIPIVIGIALSIIGGSITSYAPSSGGDGEDSILGAVLVFVSISMFVAYSRCGGAKLKKLPDTVTAGLTSLAAMIVVGDICFAAVGWDLVELKYDFSPTTLALIFWMGGVAVGIAMSLWFASIRLIGVTFTTMHHNLVPFYVILLSLWWSGGTVSVHHWIGAGFVIAGAIVAQFSSDRHLEETHTPPRPRATTQHQTYAPATMHLQQPHVVSPTVSVVAPPSVPQRAQGRDIETGMIIMVCAMLILPAIDTFAKLLSHTVQAGQVSWSRFAFQTVLLAPLALIKVRSWDLTQLPIHAARGFLIALATLLFFAALKVLPVADAISIFFIEPLVLTLLSAVLLGETVGWRRLLAVAVGFVGAMIVIRPSYDVFGARALLPLGAAVAFALYLMLTRKVALREDPITTQFMAGVFGVIIMTIALWAGATLDIPVITPVWPTPYECLLLAGVGVIATIGHLMVVHAFKRAEAGILAPFQYLEIIPSVILGLLVFGDFPDIITWCGIAIIVGSGLYVFYRERSVARRDAEEAEWQAQTMYYPPPSPLPHPQRHSQPVHPMAQRPRPLPRPAE